VVFHNHICLQNCDSR